MRSILLTWDIEEYDAPADFGAVLLPDGGLARGLQIWHEWLDISQTWNVRARFSAQAELPKLAPISYVKLLQGVTKLPPTAGPIPRALISN